MTDRQTEVSKSFLLGFDELNVLVSGAIDSKSTKSLEDAIVDAYVDGFYGVGYMLGEPMPVDVESARGAAVKYYDGISIYDKAKEYIEAEDREGLQRLYESEYHRAYEEGQFDAAADAGAMYKTWVSMEDERVRDSHQILDMVTIPIEDYFIADDGDYGLYPGGFQTAEQNANCRCMLLFS